MFSRGLGRVKRHGDEDFGGFKVGFWNRRFFAGSSFPDVVEDQFGCRSPEPIRPHETAPISHHGGAPKDLEGHFHPSLRRSRATTSLCEGPALEFSQCLEEQGSWNDDGGFAFSNFALHIRRCQQVIQGVPDNDDFITLVALHNDRAAAIGVTARC